MPKDREKKKYLTVAIPYKNTLLLQGLAQEHEQTCIPESQLLVRFATEYIKLMMGQSSLVMLGQPSPLQIQGVPQPGQMAVGKDAWKQIGDREPRPVDFDAYGPPDE